MIKVISRLKFTVVHRLYLFEKIDRQNSSHNF